jgi:ABC-type cobalamin/Fe3+-siderophores transport system ATPase subunit
MVLEDGRVAGDGTAEEVLNPALIARVFGVQATLHGGLHRGWMSYEA